MFSKTSHFGITLGIILIASFVLQYQQNIHIVANNTYAILMLPVSVAFIIFSIVKVSKGSNEEGFSIRKGLQTGIGVILISGIIFWLYQVIHATFIEPDYIDKFASVAQKDLQLNEQFTPEQVQEKIKLLKENYKFAFFMEAVIKSLFTGFFVSLITSLVIKAFYKR